MRNLSSQFIPRYNPATQGARFGTTIRAGESIPEGHSITGFTYQSDEQGKHAGTLLHVKEEWANKSLGERVTEWHRGWDESTPPLDTSKLPLGERRSLREST